MAALVPALLGLAACAQAIDTAKAPAPAPESGPPPDSLLTQAITQPYHIVTTPRLERPIVFERQ
jgi:hypothetical protein